MATTLDMRIIHLIASQANGVLGLGSVVVICSSVCGLEGVMCGEVP